MKKLLFLYVMMICVLLVLLGGCTSCSEEKATDSITSPEITKPVQNEFSATVEMPEVDLDTQPSETVIIPETSPTLSFDSDSPLEIEVEIKQPWDDEADGNENEIIVNAGSDNMVDMETEPGNQNSTEFDRDTELEEEQETEETQNDNSESETTPTSSPSDDTEPDFSLEIE